MAKIKDVTIINSTTLRLEVDAKKGDEIDLLDLNKVDTSSLLEKINAANDAVYQQKLLEAKEVIQKDIDLEVTKAVQEKALEIERLQSQINTIAKDNELRIREAVQTKELEIEKLKGTVSSIKNEVESKIRLELNETINNLERQLQQLKNDKQNELERLSHEKEQRIIQLQTEQKSLEENVELKVRAELNEEINNLKSENQALKHGRASKNTKRIGEELETWCKNEYASYSMAFTNCTFIKDTKASASSPDEEKTKADFIFDIFSNNQFKEEDRLTRVLLEMKTEDPTGASKKTNASHIAKLKKDKLSRNAEYAVLVSELEWDSDNDPLISKVEGEDNIYIVRPPYFVTFLSLINALALKYREIKEKYNRQNIEFKEIDKIMADFESMKSSILDTTLKNIDKQIETLQKNNNTLSGIVQSNQSAINTIVNTHLSALRRKVENFEIKKIVKKIENLE